MATFQMFVAVVLCDCGLTCMRIRMHSSPAPRVSTEGGVSQKQADCLKRPQYHALKHNFMLAKVIW